MLGIKACSFFFKLGQCVHVGKHFIKVLEQLALIVNIISQLVSNSLTIKFANCIVCADLQQNQ